MKHLPMSALTWAIAVVAVVSALLLAAGDAGLPGSWLTGLTGASESAPVAKRVLPRRESPRPRGP